MTHKNSPKQPITGIVLSGGYSTRFQKENEPWVDKALMSFDGEVLLQRTIKMLSNICDRIVIMVKFDDRKLIYQKYIDELSEELKAKVFIAKDNNRFLCNGPTLGIISSLDFVENDIAIVVPADLPLLTDKILTDLLAGLGSNSMVVPYWHTTGKIEPLVFACKLKSVQTMAKILSQVKRSRADDLHRAFSSINFLSFSSKQDSEIDEIFTSLNDRTKLTKLSKVKVSQLEGIFDPSNSQIINKHLDEDLIKEIEVFLKKYNLLRLQEESFSKSLELSKKLIAQKMYFVAGIFLFSVLSGTSLNESKNKENMQYQLIELCLESFKQETSQWQEKGIRFLELHSLSDAAMIAKMFDHPSLLDFERKIIKLKELLNLKKKKHDEYSLDAMLESKLPSFLNQANEIIQESENSFNEDSPTFSSNFLWDHSLRVGKIAYKLALEEGINPLVPTVAAILHDAGKFVLGKYHSDNVTEEEHSSSIAQKLLENSGLTNVDIVSVKVAINSLYSEKLDCNINCKIVHDADRLEKLGPLGIANFFTKMTLRGANLSSSILRNLSRELTYTSAAPKTMLTRTGKQLAQTRSQKAVNYFMELLDEFAYYDLGRFHVKEFEVDAKQTITLVIPEKCQKCNGAYSVQLSKEMGIKCEKVIATYSCNKCEQQYKTEFCLPLIAQ
jgi:molybdopterin-guanine dinucleotide biosynthesis protein A/HD superfamily phosphodiesterase